MAHVDKHPVPVDGCYNCKLLGVGIHTYNLAQDRMEGVSRRAETDRSLRRFEQEHGYPAEKA